MWSHPGTAQATPVRAPTNPQQAPGAASSAGASAATVAPPGSSRGDAHTLSPLPASSSEVLPTKVASCSSLGAEASAGRPVATGHMRITQPPTKVRFCRHLCWGCGSYVLHCAARTVSGAVSFVRCSGVTWSGCDVWCDCCTSQILAYGVPIPPLPPYQPRHLLPQCCHYADCGCSSAQWMGPLVDWIWSSQSPRRVPRLARGAQVPGLVVSNAHCLVPVAPTEVRRRRLRIAYYVPHHNVTGGMKMLVRHMDLLRQRGHYIIALFRPPTGHALGALPPWAVEAGVKVDHEILLLPTMSPLCCFTPSLTGVVADVLMMGYFTQLVELKGVTSCPGPVVYWEQGHEHLFCDPTASRPMDKLFHWSLHLPIFLLSVSGTVRDFLVNNFGRVAPVVPNAIGGSMWAWHLLSFLLSHVTVSAQIA